MNYITTPIYYTNGEPHIGSAYTTLIADVLARFWRLQNQDVFFLTGTDEHGAKIAEAAQKEGKSPQEFVDTYAKQFESTWQSLNIQPDGFIRTSDPKHEAFVQAFLQDLYDKGFIYKGEYKGWYCVGCEEFKTATQIGPDFTCPIHLTPLKEVAEEAYLFKLPQFKAKLVELIQSDELKIRPESRKNEVLGFIEHEDLQEVAISRKNVAWGISVPWDESHTVYVWVDALLNYLSAAHSSGPDFKSGKKPTWPPTLQLIGKDILRFHAVIWPALLLAAEKELPKKLFVHGYFTLNGHKISKSLGNIILPQELIDRYGVDATRYLLLVAIPFGHDGDISLERLDTIYTSDLANNLGNLVNRVQAMLQKYRDGKVPTGDVPHIGFIKTGTSPYKESFSTLGLGGVLSTLTSHIDELNQYIQEKQPWILAKENSTELDQVLLTLTENIFILGALFAPFTPDTSAKILSLFGTSIGEVDYDTLGKTSYTAGKTIQPISPLFPRLEQ